MSQQVSRVAGLLLEESFGQLVKTVGQYLLQHGSVTVVDITRGIELSASEVRKCLAVLLQHRVLSYTPHHGRTMMYSIDITTVFNRILFSYYIMMAREAAGEMGELIVEDLLQYGQSTMAQSESRVGEQLHDGSAGVINTQFKLLVDKQYLTCSDAGPSELMTAAAAIQQQQSPARPGKRKRKKGNEEEPAEKRQRSDGAMVSDDQALWHVNMDKFNQEMRNQSIVSAATELIDTTAGSIMKAILGVSNSDSQVYPLQIMESLPGSISLTHDNLEQYLTLLVEDKLLNRTGDASGGTYTINYKQATELLCRATLESVVRERFGSKPLRVFRLLLVKQHLEQKQVSDMALVPSKEAKEILYSLLAENFVSLQEIPRSADYAPSRTFYLFFVNLQQVARMVMERCYKALGNMIARRNHETNENRRLLDKYQLWERQRLDGQEGTEEELEEALTPEERKAAERVKQTINKLEQGELKIVDTITTLQDYLKHTI